MPNITHCSLYAPEDVIRKYLIKNENENYEFDFNLVIPQPKEYSDPELVAGGQEDFAIYWYLTNTEEKQLDEDHYEADEKYLNYWSYMNLIPDLQKHKAVPKTAEELQELYELGKKYVDLADKYGYRDWYDWRRNNWGTKWNASDTIYSPDHKYVVEFDTEWDPPMPVINKIFADNPNCDLRFEWVNEDYDGDHFLKRDYSGHWVEGVAWAEESEDSDETD